MLKIKDFVTVKPNTEDPDFGGDIGGWQGRITEINSNDTDELSVMIEWDANTLKNMPKAFLRACFRDGYDHERMSLYASEVQLVKLPTFIGDRKAILDTLNKEYAWEDFGDQGLRIKTVEDACENDFDLMDRWFEYLESHVKLPITAKYVGDSNHNLPQNIILEINGFADSDEQYGVIGSARYNKRWIEVPLCDLQVLESNPGTQALEDYIVWYLNR